jgi:regulator of replication initiation timing
MFCTDDWDILFPDAHLQAISSRSSDHSPLILQGDASTPRKPSFKFEEFWLRLPGFAETVALAWNKHVTVTDAIRRIHIKLARTAKSLKKWQRERVGILQQQIILAKEVILQLDVAEENKTLSLEERQLRRRLKANYLGLLSLQKVKVHQRARLTWIKTADANTKLFHIRVNGRRRKLLIQSLHTNDGIAITQDDKEKELHSYFHGHLGIVPPRTEGIDWAGLGYQPHDLSALEANFNDEEIKGIVFSLPSVKAPGPDGFIGAFFKACWETNKARHFCCYQIDVSWWRVLSESD